MPTFVSSLKMAQEPASAGKATDGRIGFIGASFKWNAGNAPADKDNKDNDTVKKNTDDDPKKKKANGPEDATAVATNGPAEEDGSATEPVVFELQDINFVFPSGALTVCSRFDFDIAGGLRRTWPLRPPLVADHHWPDGCREERPSLGAPRRDDDREGLRLTPQGHDVRQR